MFMFECAFYAFCPGPVCLLSGNTLYFLHVSPGFGGMVVITNTSD